VNKIAVVLIIAAASTVTISVLLGGHAYGWEVIVWAWVAVVWAVVASHTGGRDNHE
jgi:hypothetical protein